MVEVLKKIEEFEIETTNSILEKIKKQLGSVSVERRVNSFEITLGHTKDKLSLYFRMFYDSDDRYWVFDVDFVTNGYKVNRLNCFNTIKDDVDLTLFSDNLVYVLKRMYDVHIMFVETGVSYFNMTSLGFQNSFYGNCYDGFYLSSNCKEEIDDLVKQFSAIVDKKEPVDNFNKNSVVKIGEFSKDIRSTVYFLYDYVKKELLKMDTTNEDFVINCDDDLEPNFEIESKDESVGSFLISPKLFFDYDSDLGCIPERNIYYRIEVCGYVSFLIPFNKVPITTFTNCFIDILKSFYDFRAIIQKQKQKSLHTYYQFNQDNAVEYIFPMVYTDGLKYEDIDYSYVYDDDSFSLLPNKDYKTRITHVILDDDSCFDSVEEFFGNLKNRLKLW